MNAEEKRVLQNELANFFAELLKKHGDTSTTRLAIANYTMGYMGASFGLHIEED